MQGLSLVAESGGHSSSRCAGLSLSRPLLLRSTGSRRAGSVVVAHGPSCSAACGIFPDQGSKPCALHWQADSQPLRHQGSPGKLLGREEKKGWWGDNQACLRRGWSQCPNLQKSDAQSPDLLGWGAVNVSLFHLFTRHGHLLEGTVTQKLDSPLGGCRAKRDNQAKIRRRKDLFLAARKENTRGLSQSSVSPSRKIGEVLS